MEVYIYNLKVIRPVHLFNGFQRFFVNPLSTAPNRTADKVEIPRSTSIAASSGGEVAGSGFLDVGTRRTSGYQGSPGGNVVGSVGSSFLQVEGNNRSPFLRVGHNVSAVDDVDDDVDRALTSAIFPQQHPANVSMTSQNENTSVKRVYSPFSDSSTSSSDTSYMSFTPSSLSDSYSMNDSTVSSSQTVRQNNTHKYFERKPETFVRLINTDFFRSTDWCR